MKRLLYIFIIVLCSLNVVANSKSVCGIFYNFDKKTQQATVTFRGQKYSDFANEYYGKVEIPALVVYNGVEYRVTAISEAAFRGCKLLEQVIIPSSVVQIGMFAFKETALENDSNYWDNGIMYIDKCVVDANIDIVEGDVVLRPDTRMIADYAFAECEKLRSMQLPQDLSNVGRMAFALCTGLEHITFSQQVSRIEDLTFWACVRLKKVVMPDNIDYMGQGVFAGCMMLDLIVLSPLNNSFVVDDGVLFTRDMTTLVCYPAGLTAESYIVPAGIKHIGAWAFEAALNIKEVGLPDGLKSIGTGAFAGCELLHTANIPSSVETIDKEAFARCFALQSIAVGSKTRLAKSVGESTLMIIREK